MAHRQRGGAFAQCRSWPVAILLAGLLSLDAGTAIGEEAGVVSLELNRLEQVDGSCRAYLVVGNGATADFESLGLDLVMFDTEGIVSGRVAVELAPLPAGKTSVRVFSLDGIDCETVGRVLLNAIVSCQDGSGERPDCLGLVETSSRAAAPFIE